MESPRKILLIHSPPVGEDSPTSPFLLQVHSPQLGLLYLASVLENEGWTVQYLDAARFGYSPEQVSEIVENHSFLWVGFHANLATRRWVCDTVKLVRANKNQVPIFIGGPGFTDAADYLEAGATGVVAGEAEEVILPLTRAVEQGPDSPMPDGVYSSPEQWDQIPLPTEPISDLDALTHPAWHLAPPKDYQDPFAIQVRSPMYYLLASRGCYMNCAFCFQTYKGAKHYRVRTVANVLAEMKELADRFGIRHIKFQDDNFGGRPKWLLKFCEEKQSALPNMTWHCSAHIHSFRKDPGHLAQALARSGCRSLHFGLQTTTREQLKEINRMPDELEVLHQVLPLLKQEGIYTVVDFIFGLPGESKQTIARHRKNLRLLQAHAIQINPLNLVPHTELHRKYNDRKFRDLDQGEIDEAIKEVFREYMLRPHVLWWNLHYFLVQNPGSLVRLMKALPLLLRLILGQFKNPWIKTRRAGS